MFGFKRNQTAVSPAPQEMPGMAPLNRNIQQMQFGRVHATREQQSAMQRRIDVSGALGHTSIQSGGAPPSTGIGETVRRQRMIHSISGQTSIPPEHLQGLNAIHYGSPETTAADTYGYYNRRASSIHLAEGPADSANARQRADFAGMFTHELGHHVEQEEQGRGAETGVLAHSMKEARAENYAAKYAPGHTNHVYDDHEASGNTGWNFDAGPYRAERRAGSLPGQPASTGPDPRQIAKAEKGYRPDTREAQKAMYPGQESREHPEGTAKV
jgi:hypothetical protein